jgi:hypothetical protein
MLRCPVLVCPPFHHIAPSAPSLLACSSNYLPVRDVAVCDCRQGRIRKPEIKCRSETTIVEAEYSARVLALYVLSGARGGTGRASYAWSVSVGFKISCWLAGVKEHVTKIADVADVPDRDVLDKVTCGTEHILHVSDTRDIPTPNILVEDISVTAFNSMWSRDVRDEICVCVCEC